MFYVTNTDGRRSSIWLLPERAGWVEALGYEDWVEGGVETGGLLGPVLRCCHPSLGLHSEQGHTNTTVKQKDTQSLLT